MIFDKTELPGVFEVCIDQMRDERGLFARTFCQQEFEAQGLNGTFVQCSLSFSKRKGTLRGMHYQEAPHQEAKLIRCVRGAIYDVVLDLRRQSPTFRKWVATVLTAEKLNMMYVPEGCAHGFLTLEDNCEVNYQMSEFHKAEAARGVRWDDPAFQIIWPEKVVVIAERDRNYGNFE